jgi:hypothetical protein
VLDDDSLSESERAPGMNHLAARNAQRLLCGINQCQHSVTDGNDRSVTHQERVGSYKVTFLAV